MKRCYKCGEVKSLEFYHKDKTRGDGVCSRCSECERRRRKERTEKNPETSKETSKRYYHLHKKEKSEYHKTWRAENWFKANAHKAVRNAITLGYLKKQPCQECGSKNSDAHHPDYTKPLEVMWLCRRHHMREHAKCSAPHPLGYKM